jgi:hypothetical protein
LGLFITVPVLVKNTSRLKNFTVFLAPVTSIEPAKSHNATTGSAATMAKGLRDLIADFNIVFPHAWRIHFGEAAGPLSV